MELKIIIKRIIYIITSFALLINGFLWGTMTLLPDDASKPCLLGYYARCSFAPISSIILLSLGVIGLILAIKSIKSLITPEKEIVELNMIKASKF